jgi:hypothetical protein
VLGKTGQIVAKAVKTDDPPHRIDRLHECRRHDRPALAQTIAHPQNEKVGSATFRGEQRRLNGAERAILGLCAEAGAAPQERLETIDIAKPMIGARHAPKPKDGT